MEGNGMMPQRDTLQRMANASYDTAPPRSINGWTLVVSTPTLKFYQLDNTIIVAIRGTVPKDRNDIEADASIALNRLENTTRYRKDVETLIATFRRFPPSQYDYYGVGHSLGGAILDSFLREGWLKSGLSYNPAVQPKDIPKTNTNQRVYQSGDPLYAVMGQFTKGAEVRAPKKKGIVDTLIRKVPVVGKVYGLFSDHQLDNFEGGATRRERFLKKYKLEDKGYSLNELAKITGVPLRTLREVYNRGIGAYKTNPQSVRMKGSFKKNVDAPLSKKLSKEQWAMSRVYSFLDGNPKHDNDLRGGREDKEQMGKAPPPSLVYSINEVINRLGNEGLALTDQDTLSLRDWYVENPRAELEDIRAYAESLVPRYGEDALVGLQRRLGENQFGIERFWELERNVKSILNKYPKPEPYKPYTEEEKAFLSSLSYSQSLSGRGKSRFETELKEIGLSPSAYLKEARRKAKSEGYSPNDLSFANNNVHKLEMRDPKTGKVSRFGRVGYKDFLMWSHLEKKGKVEKGTADSKRERFQKSHSAIKGDWKHNPFSPNRLALSVLW